MIEEPSEEWGRAENKGQNIEDLAQGLEQALVQLDHVWRKGHLALKSRLADKEQSAEQLMQTLRVQSSHWKSEAERLSTKLDKQNQFQQRAQKAEQELSYLRQNAQQWQERAQSWKEEARRSEEARVAALHKASNNQPLKQAAQELSQVLGEAIDNLKQVIKKSPEVKDENNLRGAG